MNIYLNKRGRGGPPKRGRRDLGRIPYIQKNMPKFELEASSLVVVRVKSHTKSEGKSVLQSVHPLAAERSRAFYLTTSTTLSNKSITFNNKGE